MWDQPLEVSTILANQQNDTARKKIVTYPKKTNFSVKTMKMFFQSETWELYSALKLGKSASYLNIEPTIFFKIKEHIF